MELIQCIERIPSQLVAISEKVETLSLLDEWRGMSRVICIGSGTSFNAAKVLEDFAVSELGLEYEVVYPNVFFRNADRYLREDVLYVCISQGGNTKLVYECMKLAQGRGYPVLALSENPEGKIPKEADVFLNLNTGREEFVFRTIGYSMSVVCLRLALVYLADADMDLEVQGLLDSAKRLSDIRHRAEAWYEERKGAFVKKEAVFLIAEDELYPLAQEADIKLMEMVPIVTRSLELEESIHGPQNCFNEDMVFFVLQREGQSVGKAHSIYDFIRNEVTKTAYFLGQGEGDFTFDRGMRPYLILEYITFFQVLSYLWAKDRGRDLTKGVYPQVTDYVKKTF